MGRDYPTGVSSLKDFLGAFRFYGENNRLSISLNSYMQFLFQIHLMRLGLSRRSSAIMLNDFYPFTLFLAFSDEVIRNVIAK